MKLSQGCVAAGLLWSLALTPLACTTGKDADRSQPTDLSDADSKRLEEYQLEMEVGRNMAGRLLAFYGRYEAQGLTNYLNDVGNYVASVGDYPDRRYMFDIIDSDEVNAFACPGGYILITLGAIRHARNEAELAMVLGHETVHVGKRHMYSTLKAMSEEDLQKAAAEAEKRGNLPEEVRSRERIKPEQSETGALVARYLSGSALGLNILAASKAGMSLILEKGLGAHLEQEADVDGVKYAVRAGYEPKALIDYLCRLEDKTHVAGKRCKVATADKKNTAASILDKTHPPVGMRIDAIVKELSAMNGREMVGATGDTRFASFTKNIPAPKTTGKK